MAKAPVKGIAQTLQDVLNNLQRQLKEKTTALNAANKKVAALSGGQGGDFTVELDTEKEKRAQAENAFKAAKAEISKLRKQVEQGSSNGKGASSEGLTQEIAKRTRVEKSLAERTEELLEVNKNLLAETQARMKVEADLNSASSSESGISEAEHQLEVTKREQAEAALQAAQSKLEGGLKNQGQDSGESEALQEEIAVLLETQATLEQEQTSLNEQLGEAQAQVEAAQNEQGQSGSEMTALQSEFEEVEKNRDQLQADKITLETQLKEALFKAEQATAGNKENTEALKSLKGETETLRADKALIEKKLKEVNAQLEGAQKTSGDTGGASDAKAFKAELEKVRKSGEILKSEKEKLAAQVTNLEAQLKSAGSAPATSATPKTTAFASPPPASKTPPPAPKAVTPQDKEMERLRQAIAKNPRDIKSMVKLAQVAFKASRHQDAIAPLSKAVKLQSKDAELFYMLGDAYYKSQQYHDALGPFNQAVRVNPKMAKAHYNLCLINELVGNEDAAQKHYQLAIKIDPKIEDKMG